MTAYHPAQVTERESDGSWEDCVWTTGVMIQNAAHAATVAPTSRAEYEALRVDGGDGPAEHTNDGSNYIQLVHGMLGRYGWAPTLGTGRQWATVQAILAAPGTAMGIQGSLRTLSTHLRRWDPGSTVSHSVFVENDGNGLWWMNPLAPASYPGEYVSWADVQHFYEGLDNAAIVWTTVGGRAAPAGGQSGGGNQGDIVTDIDVTSTGAELVDLPAGTAVLNLDGSARLSLPTARQDVLSPFGSTSSGGTALRAIVYSRPAPDPDLLLAVYSHDVDNARPYPPPAPPPPPADCTVEVQAEHDRVKALAVAAAEAIA